MGEGKWGDCAWRLRGSKFRVERRRSNDEIPGLLRRIMNGWMSRREEGFETELVSGNSRI